MPQQAPTINAPSAAALVSRSSISSSLNSYVAPFVATLDVSGTADVTSTALAQQTVTITGVQQTFNVTLGELDTYKLLNAFTVSGGVNADLGDGTTSFDVMLADVSGFREVIAGSIQNATNADSAPVPEWLNLQLGPELDAHILNTLGLQVAATSSITVDASAGAISMAGGFSDPVCEDLYLQIDQQTLNLYQDASSAAIGVNPRTSALPMKAGDVITFVFDTTAPVVSITNHTATANASNAAAGANAATADVNTGAAYAYDTVTLKYASDSYRVAFAVTLAGTPGDAFPVGNAGLKSW